MHRTIGLYQTPCSLRFVRVERVSRVWRLIAFSVGFLPIFVLSFCRRMRLSVLHATVRSVFCSRLASCCFLPSFLCWFCTGFSICWLDFDLLWWFTQRMSCTLYIDMTSDCPGRRGRLFIAFIFGSQLDNGPIHSGWYDRNCSEVSWRGFRVHCLVALMLVLLGTNRRCYVGHWRRGITMCWLWLKRGTIARSQWC